MVGKLYLIALPLVGLTAWIATGALATTHDFFKGKTVRIAVGASAGGGNDEDRQLLEVGIQFPALLSLAYALPPATAKDRVQLLRKAFMDTVTSADFLADTQKSKLNVDPTPGEELERTINRLFKLTPAIVGKLKDILK